MNLMFRFNLEAFRKQEKPVFICCFHVNGANNWFFTDVETFETLVWLFQRTMQMKQAANLIIQSRWLTAGMMTERPTFRFFIFRIHIRCQWRQHFELNHTFFILLLSFHYYFKSCNFFVFLYQQFENYLIKIEIIIKKEIKASNILSKFGRKK